MINDFNIVGLTHINVCHVFTGNMWSQTWGGVNDLLEPYPGKPAIDISKELKKQVCF